MPKLTMWKPQKTKDYYFMDRTIREQFFVGGTSAYIHKYIGPYQTVDKKDKSQPNYLEGTETDPVTGKLTNPEGLVNETKIQDLLFLENRDRKYESDVYELRGVYNVTDNDFDLSQFGLILSNDTLYLSFHLNEMVEVLGRKLMSGDVLELPHVAEYLGLEITESPIPKYYVVQDGNRGGEGFSQTWWPHIWRVKIGPILDSQEFAGILKEPGEDDRNESVSIYNKILNANNQIVSAAKDNAESYTTSLAEHLFGFGSTETDVTYDPSIPTGTAFPSSPNQGDYFVRTDYNPNRLFVRRGTKWHRIFDRTGEGDTWEQKTFNSGKFVNNEEPNMITNTRVFAERQPISSPIPPKIDKGNI
jgi:hypothetical protein